MNALAPPANAAATDLVYDRQVEVETPEHVTVGYQLADLGSRFTALLLDWMVLFVAWIVLGVVLSVVWGVGGSEIGQIVVIPVLVVAGFLSLWGYFFAFEAFRDGQTPGKRWMGLRVVQDGGYPLTPTAAGVRNLIRIIDIQPGLACLVGGTVMMLHPRTKRLGDLVAGTVVVRDRSHDPIPEEAEMAAGPTSLGPPRLTDAEWAAVQMYHDRADQLEPAVRLGIGRRLMEGLQPRLAGDDRVRTMRQSDFLAVLHDEEGRRRAGAGAGGRAGTAQATALLRRQRETWRSYETLLHQAQSRGGLKKLDESLVSRFAGLYREVAADLARARTYGGSPPLLYSLERSVGAGHNLLYRPEGGLLPRLRRFVMGGFAALVRRRWIPVAVSAVLFWGPFVGTYAAVRVDPSLGPRIVPSVMITRAEEAAEKEARGEGYVETEATGMPAFASFLISNNVQVAFYAFVGGITAALLTVFVLVNNGVSLGAGFAVFGNAGQLPHILDFVAGHGPFELTAIVIAGGAGLWVGSAFLVPGRRTRGRALVERGTEAVKMIVGVGVMLILAGLIEGFISPSDLPRELKFALGGLFAVMTLAYFTLAGRNLPADPAR